MKQTQNKNKSVLGGTLVRVSIAEIKYHDQNQAGEEGVSFILFFQVTVHH